MGCDIHLYVETRQQDGTWKAQGEFVRNEDDGEEGWMECKTRFYSDRNYDLFAILADVRNGRGFAGIKTGEGFNPISEPRGVPGDASPEYKQIVEQWDCDGHSHSYHTLRDLLDYDWTQETGKQGWVTLKEWVSWSRWDREQGLGPKSYCGGISGQDVKHLDAEAMDALLVKMRALETKEQVDAFINETSNTYGLAQWGTPYYRAASHFLSDTVPKLLKLAGGTAGLDDVRIVFFFDN